MTGVNMNELSHDPFGAMLQTQIKEEVYKVLKMRSAVRVPKDNFRIYVYDEPPRISEIGHTLAIEMEHYILGHTKEVSEQVPLTWWDHLKQDYAPAWFRKRYPVKLRTIKFEANIIFPHSKRALSQDDIGRGYVRYRYLETKDFSI